MEKAGSVFVGGGGEGYRSPQSLLLGYGNRHGLVAGATGTGKTVTLQVLAEGFSSQGVPVFMADVKGDLAGLCAAGSAASRLHDAFLKRAETIGWTLDYTAFPVVFWDLFGQQGHPVRATVTEMGPLLLSRLLELSEPQEGVLNIAFRLADEEALPLLDLKDLQAMLVYIGENADRLGLRYGNISAATVGSIQRALLVLENQGAARFFGEPALELADLMAAGPDGRGRVNILAADRLMASPRLYATFLLWLLSELFEELPEVGDPEKPKLVFFFDEAHLLFKDAPKALVDKVEQVARLIRSKGVGVFFITQNPADIPDAILGQLGNRVQHALRAFTAKDQKDLARAAENYRPNPRFDTETAIKEVGTGEAVTSLLEARGIPGMVERTLVRPPNSHVGPVTPELRTAIIAASGLGPKYSAVADRESAYEKLAARTAAATAAATASTANAGGEAGRQGQTGLGEAFRNARRYQPGAPQPQAGPDTGPDTQPGTRPGTRSDTRPHAQGGGLSDILFRGTGKSGRGDSLAETFAKSAARSLGSRATQQIVRGILGGLFRSR
ncbi:MAG: helicase HerA-like domain-containing protein [Pseudomonadota bacterium]